MALDFMFLINYIIATNKRYISIIIILYIINIMGIINSKVDLNRLKQYSRYELKIESYYYPNIILNLDT